MDFFKHGVQWKSGKENGTSLRQTNIPFQTNVRIKKIHCHSWKEHHKIGLVTKYRKMWKIQSCKVREFNLHTLVSRTEKWWSDFKCDYHFSRFFISAFTCLDWSRNGLWFVERTAEKYFNIPSGGICCMTSSKTRQNSSPCGFLVLSSIPRSAAAS